MLPPVTYKQHPPTTRQPTTWDRCRPLHSGCVGTPKRMFNTSRASQPRSPTAPTECCCTLMNHRCRHHTPAVSAARLKCKDLQFYHTTAAGGGCTTTTSTNKQPRSHQLDTAIWFCCHQPNWLLKYRQGLSAKMLTSSLSASAAAHTSCNHCRCRHHT